MPTLTTTLKLLRKNYACTSRYKVLLTALGGDYPQDKPINLLAILDHNGLDDALWALRATAENCDKAARLMSADFAEQVFPIWLAVYPDDHRPELAIQAARDFANGLITIKDLDAADAAADAACAAAHAAHAAARSAADAAADAACAAACAAAAKVAAQVAACAAACAAARSAARSAAREKHREIFIKYLQPTEEVVS